MPIKFRCEHCRQLMGIAHSKAGSLVDCPTCGRTLRVPNRDGSVDAMPAPRVDLADDGLRKALDELAQIGADDEVPFGGTSAKGAILPDPSALVAKESLIGFATPAIPTSPEKPPAAVTNTVPPPKPTIQLVNSIALEPLPPQVVQDVPAPASRAVSALAQPLSLAEASPEQILAGLAKLSPNPGPAAVAIETMPVSKPGISRKFCVLVGLICFALGGAGGWWLRDLTIGRTAQSPAQADVAKVNLPVAKPVIKGRITYRNAHKQREPDVGAVVILLPIQSPAENEPKLSAVGLRPSDEPSTREHATKALLERGGNLAVVDEDGNYQVEVGSAGDYRLIVLSRFQGRTNAEDTTDAPRETVALLFDRPNQLLGNLAFTVTEVKHKGSGPLIWDHTFGDS